jgi:hypothetical protein
MVENAERSLVTGAFIPCGKMPHSTSGRMPDVTGLAEFCHRLGRLAVTFSIYILPGILLTKPIVSRHAFAA